MSSGWMTTSTRGRCSGSEPRPARPASTLMGRRSCRLQQTDNLAEKRQVDAGAGAQTGAANLDLDRRGAGSSTVFRHNRHKIRQGTAGLGERAEAQLSTPHVKLIAVQPVTQRDRARHCSRRQALRENHRLLRRTPASPPRRSRQNLNSPETVPINWPIIWQTSLPAPSERDRIIRSPSALPIRGQRSAYGFSALPLALGSSAFMNLPLPPFRPANSPLAPRRQHNGPLAMRRWQ